MDGFHDADDPLPYIPPSAFQQWLGRHWEFWKMTWPTQTLWLLIYLLITIIGYSIVGVRMAKAHEPHEAHADWFKAQRINPETNKRLGTNYNSCCDKGDHYETRFKLVDDGSRYGVETYEYWVHLEKRWKVVPQDIIQRKKTPDGRPVLFRSPTTGVEYCFIIDEPGI